MAWCLFRFQVGASTPLHRAAIRNKVPAMDLLMALGADPSATTTMKGRTPLHQAAYWCV